MIDDELRVMFVMTNLRHASEQLITKKLISRKMNIRNRTTLRMTLNFLCELGILKHDINCKTFVYVSEMTDEWRRYVSSEIANQELQIKERKKIFSKIEDQIMIPGFNW
jgi:hypothetical protein